MSVIRPPANMPLCAFGTVVRAAMVLAGSASAAAASHQAAGPPNVRARCAVWRAHYERVTALAHFHVSGVFAHVVVVHARARGSGGVSNQHGLPLLFALTCCAWQILIIVADDYG